ncbi:MAG: hypothetical protein SF069_17500 [Phycisphaerae bacterium]|nr:hypothetical protein [Phycisphaerae bacterium]
MQKMSTRARAWLLTLSAGAVLPQLTNCLSDQQLTQILQSVVGSALNTIVNSIITNAFPTA